jgi:hypothetical protein
MVCEMATLYSKNDAGYVVFRILRETQATKHMPNIKVNTILSFYYFFNWLYLHCGNAQDKTMYITYMTREINTLFWSVPADHR